MEEKSTEYKVNRLNLFYQNCNTNRFIYNVYDEEHAEVLWLIFMDAKDKGRKGISHFFRFEEGGRPVVMMEKEIDRHYRASQKGVMLGW